MTEQVKKEHPEFPGVRIDNDPPDVKTTWAEDQLYGSYAGIVRLLGKVCESAHDACRLACDIVAEGEALSSEPDPEPDRLYGLTAAVYAMAHEAHREIASTAIRLEGRIDRKGESHAA